MSLDPGKLTSVDQHGDRISIIPAEVRGYFRKHRTWTQIVLLVIFLGLPWTKINGHQSLLLDIPEREFYVFGVVFRAHDVPLLFFILAALALGLAFVTSVWGRVWCGWACPQTVFIDGVFRRIEKWTEGSYIDRRRLQSASLSGEKIRKSGLKWLLFFVVSSVIAHSFLAYFVGAQDLLAMMQGPPQDNRNYFLLATFFTALILFDFGWFREQFCVIMCPYGRIQSVLLDSKSLAVVYDVNRGEPRKGANKDPQAKVGDCVACNRCVQVCPTGIDIRNGLQMECIACTACVDACDEIMTKVKKPTGLIRYDTLDGSKISLLKPRSILYMLGIAALIGGLSFAVGFREPAHIAILRGLGVPYSHVKGIQGEDLVLNQFRLHIQNQGEKPARYELTLAKSTEYPDLQMQVAENPLKLSPQEFREWFFFFRVPPSYFKNSNKFSVTIELRDLESDYKTSREIILIGPQL